MLQFGDRIRGPHVLFAAHAERVFAAGIKNPGKYRVIAECGQVKANRLLRHFEYADALDAGGRPAEVFVHHRPGQTDYLEDLRSGIGHVRGNAHFGHDFHQALADRLDVVLDALLAAIVLRDRLVRVEDGLHRQAGVDRLGTVAGQQGEVMDFACRTGFHDQAGTGAQSLADQMLVNAGQGQQRGYRNMRRIDLAVGHDEDVVARTHRVLGLRAQARKACFDRLLAPGHRIGDVDFKRLELAARVVIDVADGVHLVEVEHRLAHFETHRRIGFINSKQVRLRSDERDQRHHQVLADRIDRRIGHLCKQLLEIVVQRLVLARQHGERRIVAHRPDGFLSLLRHRAEDEFQVLLGIAEGLLAVQHRHLAAFRDLCGRRQVVQLDTDAVDPGLVGLDLGERVLQLLVVDDAPGLDVDQKHLAGLQAPLFDDFLFRDREDPGFGRHHHHVVAGYDVAGRAQPVAV